MSRPGKTSFNLKRVYRVWVTDKNNKRVPVLIMASTSHHVKELIFNKIPSADSGKNPQIKWLRDSPLNFPLGTIIWPK